MERLRVLLPKKDDQDRKLCVLINPRQQVMLHPVCRCRQSVAAGLQSTDDGNLLRSAGSPDSGRPARHARVRNWLCLRHFASADVRLLQDGGIRDGLLSSPRDCDRQHQSSDRAFGSGCRCRCQPCLVSSIDSRKRAPATPVKARLASRATAHNRRCILLLCGRTKQCLDLMRLFCLF